MNPSSLSRPGKRRGAGITACLFWLCLFLPSGGAAEPVPVEEAVRADSPVAPDEPAPAQAPRYHRVAPGDTLFSLGLRYGVSVARIRQANGLSSDRIIAGRTLVVPAAGDSGAGREIPAGPEETIAGIIRTALGFLDTRYQLGGNGQGGIDCSGLVKESFRRHGIDLPRTAREQFRRGEPVERRAIQAGDLLFYRGSRTAGVAHVGIYLGGDRLLHASRNARRVVVSDIASNNWYASNFLGARRVATRSETPAP